MSCSAETASRMKSKLPACFFISSALRETSTSSAPRRSASSFLSGEVVKLLLLDCFSGRVLFVGDLFHPLGGLAVGLFHNGDVCHGRACCCAVPVLFTRRKPD